MTQMATPAVDQQKQEMFAEKMIGVVNAAGLAMMISIGHRTRLFDMMARTTALSSAALAAATQLDERYVREWLNAMTCGGVVEYDADAQTYRLPAEHAAWLTRAATPDNIAATMQWISVLGGVEDRVVEKFHTGGGVDYCHFGRFHEVMAEDSYQTTVAGLLDHIIPMVDGLWQRLEVGMDVLDLGCGSGRALMLMAETFPNSRFVGYDLSADATEAAMMRAQQMGLTNVRFEARDVTKMNDVAMFDMVCAFDAIHDQARPDLVLRAIRMSLRDGGMFLMQDIGASSYVEKNIDHPLGTFFYTISTMHCMTVSLAQVGGMGLGTCWGEELAVKMLGEAGFGDVHVQRLPHDMQNSYYVARM